jgi:dTDP-4-amino-4,6-dideoxygalactose transaminase
MVHLKDAGVSTGVHYPIPLHMQQAYRSLDYAPGAFPINDKVTSESVSLPMFPRFSRSSKARREFHRGVRYWPLALAS